MTESVYENLNAAPTEVEKVPLQVEWMTCVRKSAATAKLIELFAATRTHRELAVVMENDEVVTMKSRSHLSDAIDVHDRRTVDSQELIRIQLALQNAQPPTKRVPFARDVQADVIPGSLDPIDVGDPQEHQPSVLLGDDTFEVPVPRGYDDIVRQRARAIAGDLSSNVVECPLETLEPEWLEDIIDRMHVKGPQSVSVVRRHEDDCRDAVHPNIFEDSESVEPGQFDVQKHEVWIEFLECDDGLVAIVAFADDLYLRLVGQEAAEPLSGERLFIDDQRPDHGLASRGGGAATNNRSSVRTLSRVPAGKAFIDTL